jgi:hypothetical protein
MVDAAFLLAADFTMKRLSPSHRAGPKVCGKVRGV